MFSIKKFSISITLAILVLFGCYTFAKSYNSETYKEEKVTKPVIQESSKGNIETITLEANYVELKSEQELVDTADLIIVGTPIDNFLDRGHRVTYSGDNTVEDYYTETRVNVKKIIKAPSEVSIDKNSDFKVVEPAVGIIENRVKGKTKVRTGPYTEMKKNMTYLMFLKKNINGDYSIMFNTLGRYNIDNKDAEDEAVENYSEEYKSWKVKKINYKKYFEGKFNL